MSAYRAPGRIVADLLRELRDATAGDTTYRVDTEQLRDLQLVPVLGERDVEFMVWARGTGGTWLIGSWDRAQVVDLITIATDLVAAADARVVEGNVAAERQARAMAQP